MLGICWTPATVQGLQKMASTVPSNPEQLLGAILVRKDIFNRFETAMRDTYMDANNLLEYLFSLYYHTTVPAGREKCQSSQSLGSVHKGINQDRKGTVGGLYCSPDQSITDSSQLPQPLLQGRLSDSKEHPTIPAEGHRKKIKTEQFSFQRKENFVTQNHGCGQSGFSTNFDGPGTFLGANGGLASKVKTQLTSDRKSQQAQSSSPLPPFSQIRHQGSRPYSPGSAQRLDSPAVLEDHQLNFGVVSAGDGSISEIKREVEELAGNQQAVKDMHCVSRLTKILKGSDSDVTGSAENTGRKKRKHQCFCGAMFTRADNLKRHIRKCHEEKQKKLSGADVDDRDPPAADFIHEFPSSCQERLETQDLHHVQQQQQHSDLQQEKHHFHHDTDMMSVPRMRWSCFCGESYEDHQKLMEHTRTHENNT